jgi:hypothetical protein
MPAWLGAGGARQLLCNIQGQQGTTCKVEQGKAGIRKTEASIPFITHRPVGDTVIKLS